VNEAGILFLVLLLAVAVLAGPILAIIALIRVRQVARKSTAAAAGDLAGRIASLSRSVEWLRTRMDALEKSRAPAAAPPPPTAPPVESTGAAPVAAAPTPAPATRRIDLESLIAGRWLNRVGIVALLLAVGFFLKYAFDNGWIGPTGRVAIGLFFGVALLVYSQFLIRRGYLYFSEGIAGTGAGVLYLSLYAAWGYYDLIPQPAAFAGMVVLTSALAAIAVGRNSQRLSVLALAGGLMTPGLLSTGTDAQAVLFTYLLVLNAGLLALGRVRTWRLLEPLALFGSVFYFVGWFDAFYDPSRLTGTLIFAALFFVEFAALAALRARRESTLLPEQYAIVLANAAWFMITLHVTLYEDHRWGLTFAVLALAAAHVVVLRLLPPGPKSAQPSPTRLLYAGLALTFVTIAIPIRLEGEWITMAWAIEGAVLVWSGFRSGAAAQRGMGLLLFVLVLIMLSVQDVDAERVLFNARFATFAVAIAALASAFFLSRSNKERLANGEDRLFGVVGVAGNVLGAWGLSLEVWDFFGQQRFGVDHELAQQMGLSVMWTVGAVALIVVGVRLASPALRWQGLALLGLAVMKGFLFDLSFLARVYRILTFFALGLVALIVSFLYQRKLFGDRTEGSS
jgi:uncharacterized membrane protein